MRAGLTPLLTIKEAAETLGSVYIVRTRKAIKVGYAKDPAKRISALQVGNSNKLTVMLVVPGTQEDETTLHRMFWNDRIRGEWFKPTTEVHGVILMLERCGSVPALVEFMQAELKRLENRKPSPIDSCLIDIARGMASQ